MEVYSWAEGVRFGVDPQLVGETIREIAAEHGVCHPHLFVEAARPEGSPLHGLWDWDRDKAAEAHFTELARRVIRSVRITYVDRESVAPAFVHVTMRSPEGRADGYMSTARALTNAEYRRQVLGEAVAQLVGLRRRHRDLTELGDVWAAVDAAAERIESQGPGTEEADASPDSTAA